MYKIKIALDIYEKTSAQELVRSNVPNDKTFNAKLSDKIKSLLGFLDSDYLNPLIYIVGCTEDDCPQIQIKIENVTLKEDSNVSPVKRHANITFSVNNNLDELLPKPRATDDDDPRPGDFDYYSGKWWEEPPFNKQKEDITIEDKITYLFNKLFSDPILFFYDMETEHGDKGDLFVEYNNNKYLFGGKVLEVVNVTKIAQDNVSLGSTAAEIIGHYGLAYDISKFLPEVAGLDKDTYAVMYQKSREAGGTKKQGTKKRGVKKRGTKKRGTKKRGTKKRGAKKRGAKKRGVKKQSTKARGKSRR
tara:strand:- start:2234 stop:3142 length:909 start_codon:yes stop_codon:yes gene_type:complete